MGVAGKSSQIRLSTAGRTRTIVGSAGFTMVELIVVLILIGILSAFGVARFFDRRQFDTATFADQARAIMRFAQKEAVAQNRDATHLLYVRFDGESISLCYDKSSPCTTDMQVVAPFTVTTDSTYCTSARWYCLRRPSTVSYAVSLGAVSAAAPRFIAFDALGRPYDDSGTALASVMTLTVSGGSDTAITSVEPETGYVH